MTIQINDKWCIEQDPYNYIPYIYDKGGKEARNPRTGEVIVTEPKWRHIGRYYPTLNKALRGILDYEIKQFGMENSVEIHDYIQKMESIAETLAKYRK